VKLASGKAAAALSKPDPNIRLFLLSGSDVAGSRMLAQRLCKALGAEKVATSTAQLKADPHWLADEAASLSMFGGPRLLWIEPAGEDILPAVEALLNLARFEAVAVAIVASAFKKTSALARFADGHRGILHVGSEPVSPREQVAMVTELARGEGLRLVPHLAERIATEANGDLMLAGLELRKFALYLDSGPDRLVELEEDVVDLLGIDQAGTDHGRPGDLALIGDLSSLADELVLLEASGIDPIPVVRTLLRRLLMLAPLCARLENGQSLEAVIKSTWSRDKIVLARILPRWTSPKLAEAVARVQLLERELILKPVPGPAALGETLFTLARAARR